MKSFILATFFVTSSAFAAPELRCSMTRLSLDIMSVIASESTEMTLESENEGSTSYTAEVSTEELKGFKCSARSEMDLGTTGEVSTFIETTFKTPVGSFSSGGYFVKSANVKSDKERLECVCFLTKI